MSADETQRVYMGAINGIVISCAKAPANDTSISDLKKVMKNTENMMKSDGADVLKPVYERNINGQKYQAFKVKAIDDEENVYYSEQFACLHKGYGYIFVITCSEIMYSEHAKAEIDKIISSIKFE